MTVKQIKLTDIILKHEGGYVNIDGDKGGETYMGVSRKSNPKWNGWSILDQYKPLKYNQKVKDRDLDTLVKRLYSNKFYEPLRIEEIKDMNLAAQLFDHSVNAGIKNGVKLLQKSINEAAGTKLKIDGVLGELTMEALENSNQEEVGENYAIGRNQYYKNLVIKNPSQKKFLKGWLNRVTDTTHSVAPSTVSLLFTTAHKTGWLQKILGFIFDHFKGNGGEVESC